MPTVKCSKKRAHQVYRSKEGKILVGASTVSKIGEDQSALQHWAWKQGVEGLDYKKLTDEAADIGTVGHFLIQCYLSNDTPDLSEFSPDVVGVGTKVFEKFKQAWKDAGLSVVASEISLVSEIGYGGTIDVIAKDQTGKIVLLDIKNQPRIYGAAYRQLAGYETLWNENHPDQVIQRRAIFRHGKKDPGDTEQRWIGDLSKHWNVFQKQLALYLAFKQL